MEKPNRILLEINNISENPQNEIYFSKIVAEEYQRLKTSILKGGLRDPLKVRKNGNEFILIAGHNRLRVLKEIGQKYAETLCYENISDADAEYLLIADNEERRQTDDPMKKALRIKKLIEYYDIKWGGARNGIDKNSRCQIGVLKDDKYGVTEEMQEKKTLKDIAKEVGESHRNTQRLLRLTELIPELQELVSAGKIGITVGEILSGLPADDQSKNILQRLSEELTGMSISEAKQLRRELEEGKSREAKLQKTVENLCKEMEKGHKALDKLVWESQEKNRKLDELEKLTGELHGNDNEKLEALDKQRKELLEEIDRLEKQKTDKEFKIKDMQYQLEQIKKSQAKENAAIMLLRKKIEPLISAKGELEYVLSEITKDPYTNLERNVNKYIKVLDDYKSMLLSTMNRIKQAKNIDESRKVVNLKRE